jgi:hypothetical protein
MRPENVQSDGPVFDLCEDCREIFLLQFMKGAAFDPRGGRPTRFSPIKEHTMTNQTAAFVPPSAEGLPPGALDSATDGASALDAWARDPYGRNFLAHALVQLARDGWLRAEPGEGFEPQRDRETPEPEDASSAVPAPATDRAAVPGCVCGEPTTTSTVHRTDGPCHVDDRADLRDRIRQAVCEAEGFGWDTDMLEPDEYGEVADAVLAVLPDQAAVRAAALHEAADAVRNGAFADTLRRMADETPPATQEPHSCPNCEGVDPDTCLMNPNRPADETPQDGTQTDEQPTETGYGPSAEELAGHLAAQRISVLQGAFRILGWRLGFELVDAVPAVVAQPDEEQTS